MSGYSNYCIPAYFFGWRWLATKKNDPDMVGIQPSPNLERRRSLPEAVLEWQWFLTFAFHVLQESSHHSIAMVGLCG